MNERPENQDRNGTYFRFFNELGIINQLAGTRAERFLPFGLTMSQFSVLNHFMRGLPPKSPLELAKAFQVTKGAMTNTVRQLETKGFVDVRPHETDGRSKIVSISDEGRTAHQTAQHALADAFSDFTDNFTMQEIGELLPALEKVRIWLDENR